MSVMIDSTMLSCRECGGPVAIVSLEDFIPGRFTICPACGLGNPPLRESSHLSHSSQALSGPARDMLPRRPELSQDQMMLPRTLRRELLSKNEGTDK